MIGISGIKDRISLREWLKALPFDEEETRRIAVTIAHRAAMRVLQDYWHWANTSEDARKFDLPALPILRVNLISGIAGEKPTLWTQRAAKVAADAAVRAAAADGAARAAVAVARAAADAVFDVNAVASFAADAAFTAAYIATDTAWEMIRADCAALESEGTRLDHVPLWHGENPLAKTWQQVRDSLPEGWEFWRGWYQDALDGKPPNWDMLTEIALIPDKDWNKGAEHVNLLIAGIVEKHRLLHEVRRLRDEMAEIRQKARRAPAAGANMLGHNNPPEMIADEPQVIKKAENIWENLKEAEDELQKPSPRPGVLKRIGQSLRAAKNYVLGLANIAAKEAAKSVGKVAGPALYTWLIVHAPAIESLGKGLIEFAKNFLQ